MVITFQLSESLQNLSDLVGLSLAALSLLDNDSRVTHLGGLEHGVGRAFLSWLSEVRSAHLVQVDVLDTCRVAAHLVERFF
jgi:hypothetical protein